MLKNLGILIIAISISFVSCAQVTTPSTSGGTTSGKATTTGKKTGQPPSTNSSSSPSTSDQTLNSLGLTNDQVIQGLKDALNIAAQKSSDNLSITDGYFKNLAIKILMPPDVKMVEDKLRSIGLGAEVDRAIVSMNRAAEEAAKDAAPIFIGAIKSMSVNDAVGIVTGPNNAATKYLESTTSAQLTTKFKPVIKSALDKVDATKYWSEVFSTYNKLPFVTPVNSDLTAYVTDKALDGLFYTMAQEEAQIRKDPCWHCQ
jgi:hypothetical protein